MTMSRSAKLIRTVLFLAAAWAGAASCSGGSAPAGEGSAGNAGGGGSGGSAIAGHASEGAAGGTARASAGHAGGGAAGATGGMGGAPAGSAGASGSAGSGGGAGALGGAGGASILGPDIPGQQDAGQQAILIGPSHMVGTNEQIVSVFSDATGDLFVAGGTAGGVKSVSRYDGAMTLKWTNQTLVPAPARVSSAAVAPSGDVFFCGSTVTSKALPGETAAGTLGDALIGKLDSTGAPAWLHQFGGPGEDSALVLSVHPDGAVLVAGQSGGAIAGSVSPDQDGPFVARYEASGTRAWIGQVPHVQGFGTALLVDATGKIYLGAQEPTAVVVKLDAGGHFLSQTALDLPGFTVSVPSFGNGNYPGDVAVAADRMGFYDVSFGPTSSLFFTFIDLTPTVRWVRPGRVVDPKSSGGTWSASFVGKFRLLVTKDSVFLLGTYRTQDTAAQGPQVFLRAFVARLDPMGSQQWFQEFLLDESLLQMGSMLPDSFGGLATDAAGDVVVVANGPGAVATATPGKYLNQKVWYAFKLNKDTGALK
jgi:hypothetical protein